jgi:hypothetical protein
MIESLGNDMAHTVMLTISNRGDDASLREWLVVLNIFAPALLETGFERLNPLHVPEGF